MKHIIKQGQVHLNLMFVKIIILAIALFIDQTNAAGKTPTDSSSCIECYTNNAGVNCITEDFKQAVCCDYKNPSKSLDRCMLKYKYCTYNLEQRVYKVFTCP